jgi:beta-phosphoglucomutase-like phosphatase (HAD superfamily)
MIRAVAWDVDGTLIDSEPVHHAALIKVSARYGLTIEVDDDRFVGVAMEDVWKTLVRHYPPALTRAGWLAEIVDAYIECAPQLRPIAGAREAVLACQRIGLPQCCVSNSARRIVDANLKAIGLSGMMEFVVAREDVADGKPDPAPYALACQRLALAPETVLAVEDSPVGAASARAAGLTVMQLGRDFTDFAVLTKSIEKGSVVA